MLTRMHIRNFKAWKDTGDIRLAPLTVFFGANSSGKTSIHQLLLMLKQTAQSPDRQRVLHLGDEKSLVDLGTFRDMIFAHDEKSSLRFEIDWSLPESLTVPDPDHAGREVMSGDRVSFASEVAQENGKSPRLAVKDLVYTLDGGQAGPVTIRMQPSPKEAGRYDLTASGYVLVRQRGRPWALPPPVRFYGFPDEAIAYFQNSGFVADLALEMERLLGRVYHVGPFRDHPKPTYVWSGERPEHVGERGAGTVAALLSAQDRKINFRAKAKAVKFPELIATRLKEMQLLDSFEAKPIAQHRKEYEVVVRTVPAGALVNLRDVGFGISQVLPILVECFYVPSHSIVLFEQPEIHLHPRAQAALADLFIDAIHARENAMERELQFIIESHSEHFLRRLQRRIAEGRLGVDETALYFCQPGQAGSELRQLDVDMFGNITNWPDAFFGDEMGDLAAMTDATIRRRAGTEG